jgi:hypothetical protein
VTTWVRVRVRVRVRRSPTAVCHSGTCVRVLRPCG